MERPAIKKCPSGESFVHFVSDELAPSEADAIIDHAGRCASCRLRLYSLLSLRDEIESKRESLPESGLSPKEVAAFRKMARGQARSHASRERAPYSRAIRLAGTMAAALLVVAAGYRFFLRASSPEPATRGRSQVQIRLHQPEGMLQEAPRVFSWSEIQGSDFYRLEIVDDNLNLVFSTALAATQLHLEEDVRLSLERRKPYLWTVTALDEDSWEIGAASGYFEIQ